MMDLDDIALLLGLAVLVFWVFQWLDFQKTKTIEAERSEIMSQPIPDNILRSIRAYLRGEFNSEDKSPLGYAGYGV